MILWLNHVSGLSGDMLLGALLGLGAPAKTVARPCEAPASVDGIWPSKMCSAGRSALGTRR
jgi:uncharacterized protein (DUF111 family)